MKDGAVRKSGTFNSGQQVVVQMCLEDEVAADVQLPILRNEDEQRVDAEWDPSRVHGRVAWTDRVSADQGQKAHKDCCKYGFHHR
jgi:hypothetical protein